MEEGSLPLDEQRIEQLEALFPLAAGAAFAKAYDAAIAAGLTVVVAEGGQIIEISPDGSRKLVKTITPPSPAQPGRKITIS